MSEQLMVIAGILVVIVVIPAALILYAFSSLYRSFVSARKYYARAKEMLQNVFPEGIFIPLQSGGFWGWFVGESLTGEIVEAGESFMVHLCRENSSESELRPLSLEISKKLNSDPGKKVVLTHDISVYRTPKLLQRPPVSTGRSRIDKVQGQFTRINDGTEDVTIVSCPSFIALHLAQKESYAALESESLSNDPDIVNACVQLLHSDKVLFVTIGGLGVVQVCLAWGALDPDPAQIRATIRSHSKLLMNLHNKILRRISR